ncbi:hypothetical protein BgiMline_031777 [Biomphalaria glabrata]|nr:hypothetical protein BgiMline_019980 [Biomphalaria glabrata]KAI8780263.1 hypothetical protein BgiBS90_019457 [Biomphalaria glabrata]
MSGDAWESKICTQSRSQPRPSQGGLERKEIHSQPIKEWISAQTVSRRFGKNNFPFSTMPKLERLKQRLKKSIQMSTEWSRKDKKDYMEELAQEAEQAAYYSSLKM